MTCFSSCFRKKLSPPARPLDIEEEVSGIQNVIIFTYKELCIATQNFKAANKIGEGGFGSVYKGSLGDGTLVALKVLSAESKQGLREFLTETKVISAVLHENLVHLYGCCVEDGHRILVYGYLENNSLAQILFGRGHSSSQLNWQIRAKICIGVAKGLAYLHEEVCPHIIHRDIKASNILLDKQLNPKISDFGLAKFFPPELTHISTRVGGTIGYLAPEYALRGQLTRKADIYSFGVLLFEIVSGSSNIYKLPAGNEEYLIDRAWIMYVKGELSRLVPSSLEGDVDEACRFFKIGFLCTQEMPKLRPSMSEVVKMLEGEADFDDARISKPGIISHLVGLTKDLNDSSVSTDSKKQYGSSSSDNTTATCATITFTSISDRSL